MSGPATTAADFYGDFSGSMSNQKFDNPYDALLVASNNTAVSFLYVREENLLEIKCFKETSSRSVLYTSLCKKYPAETEAP